MEGISRLPAARLAEYQRAHPGTVISRVEGIWRAWVPGRDSVSGELTHGRTEDELLAKLDGAPG